MDATPDATPETVSDAERDPSRPFINEEGVLVVPGECDAKWRWWTPEGMSLDEILVALEATRTVWDRYSTSDYPDELAKLHYPLVTGVE